ncbi:Aste57867_8495 [Aphanomyces stellatus]|uniref:Aste57867_8495 protein n=1 Tax=Aphanomyces stellatus TaxID=120398 RepID=A0A485KKH2_9STRA|nr:hypothetical protein As57867_008463 [Aphanomyces stellatus]VFT85381.1 Aste57867_8495 [Aphanomyces stellatus]
MSRHSFPRQSSSTPIVTHVALPHPLVLQDPKDYYVMWEGGNLGFTLTASPPFVLVGRVTGKGCPIGLERIRRGDVLLAINGTKPVDLSTATTLLCECPLPAILHFGRHALIESGQHRHRLEFEPPRATKVHDATSPTHSSGATCVDLSELSATLRPHRPSAWRQSSGARHSTTA